MILFRTPVRAFGLRGVVPANFAALGDQPSPLANDAVLPADADTEWLWTLLTPLVATGTTQVNDLGGYALIDPANGTWVQAYRGLTMPPSGSVTVYESSITTNVGGAIGASVGSVAWSGTQATISPQSIAALIGSASWAGVQTSVAAQTIGASVGAFSWAGVSAGINTGTTISAAVGAVAWAGVAAVVVQPVVISAVIGAVTWAGRAAQISGGASSRTYPLADVQQGYPLFGIPQTYPLQE